MSNDNTPCVVWFDREDLPGDYSKVMRKKEAIELAKWQASMGCVTVVYELVEITSFNGGGRHPAA